LPPVVFFETSVLIAASIRDIESSPKLIEHEFYDGSIGLIRLSSTGMFIGITSYTVEEQAESKLETALKDTIEESIGTKELTDMDRDVYSTILDKVERNFRANIRVLDRLATNPEDVRKTKTEEVLPMYGEIAADRPSTAWTLDPKLWWVTREVNKIQWKRFSAGLKWKEIIPDPIDMEILSEAIYLKRNRFPEDAFFLASTDKHFSGSSIEPWKLIPPRINKQFQINCAYPKTIMNSFSSARS
jgi:hypothetical protein